MRIRSASWSRTALSAVLLLALGLLGAPTAATAAGRVALVVGNSAYAEIGTLPNPGNDATDVASALGRLGVRGGDGARCRPGGHERGAARFHAPQRGGRTWRWSSTPATVWRWTG